MFWRLLNHVIVDMVTLGVLVGPVFTLLAFEVLDEFAKSGPDCRWVHCKVRICEGTEYPEIGYHGNDVVGIVHVPVTVWVGCLLADLTFFFSDFLLLHSGPSCGGVYLVSSGV